MITAPREGRAPVQPDTEPGGRTVRVNLAVVGNEALGRVLRRDAALHRVAVERHAILLRQIHFGTVQRQPLRDLNLAAHHVDARHHFRDRVLHLYARVHFDEEPLARVRIHQELHRARVDVPCGAGQRDRGVGQRAADFRIQRNRRRHLHHLLMAALHRAIAFVQVQNVAVIVAQYLHFDVLGAAHEAFQEHSVIAERGGRLAARLFQLALELRGAIYYAHAPAAPAEGGFDNQRITDLAGDFRGLLGIGDGFLAAGNARNARFLGESPRRGLIAKQVEQIRGRADENDTGSFAGAGQRGVLGKKSVPRVNRVHTLLFGQRDNTFDIQVSLYRTFALANKVSLVRFEAVQRKAVFFGINGDSTQPQLVGGAQNANSDFAAIQCKEFIHVRGARKNKRAF